MRLEDSIAICVNRNAGSVTNRLLDQLHHFSSKSRGRVRLYASESLAEAQEQIEEIVRSDFGLVVPFGGDGTVLHVVNSMIAAREAQGLYQNQTSNTVRLALVKGGTGNALAGEVGASRKWKKDLTHILPSRLGVLHAQRYSFPLLRVQTGFDEQSLADCDPRYFTFAGAGWDGLVVNEYERLKAEGRKKGNPFSRLVSSGLIGYFRAGFLHAMPHELSKSKFQGGELIVNSGRAFALDLEGNTHELSANPLIRQGNNFDLLESDILRRKSAGPVHAAIFGTSRRFGYDFDAFRNVGHAKHYEGGPYMQIHVVQGGLKRSLANIIPFGLLKFGVPHVSSVRSYFARDVTLKFFGGQEEIPCQIGGDALGTAKLMRVQVSPYTLEAVDYRKLRT